MNKVHRKKSGKKKWFFGGVAILLSLLLVPFLIEAGLYLHKTLVLPPDTQPGLLTDHTDLVIRCFGDSYTQGVGASSPEFAYPAQLESILRKRYPKINVTVVNEGQAGSNSSEIYLKLKESLQEPQKNPTIILVVTGNNNDWNLHQCSLLLEGYPTSPFHLKWIERLERTRFGKLAVITYGRGLEVINHLPLLKDFEKNFVIDRADPGEAQFLKDWLAHDLPRFQALAKEKGVHLVLGEYNSSWCNMDISRISNEHSIHECRKPEDGHMWKELGLLSQDQWHPNDKGYRAYAENIADCLENLAIDDIKL